MDLYAHITVNEIAFVLGTFLCGFAAGAAVVWQLVRGRLGR